jgi:glycosyltransferase involved in cell wall biosynthesis
MSLFKRLLRGLYIKLAQDIQWVPVNLIRTYQWLKIRASSLFRFRKIAKFQPQIEAIAASHGQLAPLIIFPPSINWDTELFQRPHHLARALARGGCLVFFLQRVKWNTPLQITQIENNLYLCDLPIQVFANIAAPIVYFLSWNCQFAGHLNNPRVLYDYLDDINVFWGVKRLIQSDHFNMLSSAHWVMATSERLSKLTAQYRPAVYKIPNGVDYAFFTPGAARNDHLQEPEDIKPILAYGKPIIGYYGALARWFDYDLTATLAQQRPDLTFLLIGPDYDGSIEKSNFGKIENIIWIGARPYNTLPVYLACFDIAVIPFIVNGITHATSPLKLFEYFAGRKPVVVTPMNESMRYADVLVAGTVDEFSTQIDIALQLKDNPDFLERLSQTAKENTWNNRANQITEFLHNS